MDTHVTSRSPRYGRGRTGLVAACLLGELYPQLTADDALARVDAYYRLRGADVEGTSPETDAQMDQVREFFAVRLGR